MLASKSEAGADYTTRMFSSVAEGLGKKAVIVGKVNMAASLREASFRLDVTMPSSCVMWLMDDFFTGCVEKPEDEQKPGDCIIAPEQWLRSNTYRYFAHQALENSTVQPDQGNLNTLLDVTRGAARLSDGIIVKVQFTTVESICSNTVPYSEKDCPPLGTQDANLWLFANTEHYIVFGVGVSVGVATQRRQRWTQWAAEKSRKSAP
ncbi:hypothetical protein HPB51_006910 [Rhipicephalus microplus]|uniref:Uncharacterized protein n=1 Tax=Rhipicephalus microplus TaxID=6941 RepID=A0A9J6DZN9_RHIMP|nr:hypothetical protein HPB51_006910 [Rhipicephalus microplus]